MPEKARQGEAAPGRAGTTGEASVPQSTWTLQRHRVAMKQKQPHPRVETELPNITWPQLQPLFAGLRALLLLFRLVLPRRSLAVRMTAAVRHRSLRPMPMHPLRHRDAKNVDA